LLIFLETVLMFGIKMYGGQEEQNFNAAYEAHII
jgi:hypothetical protein